MGRVIRDGAGLAGSGDGVRCVQGHTESAEIESAEIESDEIESAEIESEEIESQQST